MKLLSCVDDFNNEAYVFLSDALLNKIDEIPDVDPGEAEFLAYLDEEEPFDQNPFLMPRLQAENKKLALPANLGLEVCQDGGLHGLVNKEFKLRRVKPTMCFKDSDWPLVKSHFYFEVISDWRTARSRKPDHGQG
jgi:hypothetical protein